MARPWLCAKSPMRRTTPDTEVWIGSHLGPARPPASQGNHLRYEGSNDPVLAPISRRVFAQSP